MPQGETRGQNLRHFKISLKNIFFYRIIKFERQVLFRTDYLCVTSDIRVHGPGLGERSKSRNPLQCAIIFFLLLQIF